MKGRNVGEEITLLHDNPLTVQLLFRLQEVTAIRPERSPVCCYPHKPCETSHQNQVTWRWVLTTRSRISTQVPDPLIMIRSSRLKRTIRKYKLKQRYKTHQSNSPHAHLCIQLGMHPSFRWPWQSWGLAASGCCSLGLEELPVNWIRDLDRSGEIRIWLTHLWVRWTHCPVVGCNVCVIFGLYGKRGLRWIKGHLNIVRASCLDAGQCWRERELLLMYMMGMRSNSGVTSDNCHHENCWKQRHLWMSSFCRLNSITFATNNTWLRFSVVIISAGSDIGKCETRFDAIDDGPNRNDTI